MSIAASDTARHRQAAADLALKLKLEPQLQGQMNTFFREVRRDFSAFYTHAGSAPDVTKHYKADLTAVLKKHYRKVFKAFGSSLRQQVEKSFFVSFTKTPESDEVDAELARLIAERADGQSNYILNTTHDELTSAVAAILAKAHANGDNLSQADIAQQVIQAVTPRQTARASMIATTETNGAAEQAKHVEASTLAAADVVIGGASLKEDVVKHWDAVLDEKTRLWHATADGQRRKIDDPFEVHAEFLMVPGDTTLGASPDNIIECRCGASYVIGSPTIL